MRSILTFMLLAMAVIFGYQFFFMKPKPDQQPPAQTQSQPAPPSAPAATSRTGPTAKCRRYREGARDHTADFGLA